MTKESRIGPVQVRFSEEEKELVKRYAERDGRTIAGLIRHVVITHIKEQEKQKETR